MIDDRTLRSLCTLVSLAEVVVVLAYFVPLTARVPFWTWVFSQVSVDPRNWQDSYVSNLLIHDDVYRHVVGGLVGLHILLCALFVSRVSRRMLTLELFFMATAWIGWTTLTARYRLENGEISKAHLIGTVMFSVSSCIYFILMTFNVYIHFVGKWTELDRAVLIFALSSFCVCILFGLYFAYCALWNFQGFGWLFEHTAFALFAAAHVFLFVLDGIRERREDTKIGGMFQFVRIANPSHL